MAGAVLVFGRSPAAVRQGQVVEQADWQVAPQPSLVMRMSVSAAGPDSTIEMSSSQASSVPEPAGSKRAVSGWTGVAGAASEWMGTRTSLRVRTEAGHQPRSVLRPADRDRPVPLGDQSPGRTGRRAAGGYVADGGGAAAAVLVCPAAQQPRVLCRDVFGPGPVSEHTRLEPRLGGRVLTLGAIGEAAVVRDQDGDAPPGRRSVRDMRALLTPFRKRRIPEVTSLDARAAAFLRS